MTVAREELQRLAEMDTMTLEDIGHELGVSRQRINQLVKKLGITRVDHRVNPHKIVREPAPVQPWTNYQGGVKQWKTDNGKCLTSGCYQPIRTKTLCEHHATIMRDRARARKTETQTT